MCTVLVVVDDTGDPERRDDLVGLHHQLCHPITGCKVRGHVRQIEEQCHQFTSIVRVDHAGTDVNALFQGEAAARQQVTPGAYWQVNANAQGHTQSFAGPDRERRWCVHVQTGRLGGASRGQLSVGVQSFDVQDGKGGRRRRRRHELFIIHNETWTFYFIRILASKTTLANMKIRTRRRSMLMCKCVNGDLIELDLASSASSASPSVSVLDVFMILWKVDPTINHVVLESPTTQVTLDGDCMRDTLKNWGTFERCSALCVPNKPRRLMVYMGRRRTMCLDMNDLTFHRPFNHVSIEYGTGWGWTPYLSDSLENIHVRYVDVSSFQAYAARIGKPDMFRAGSAVFETCLDRIDDYLASHKMGYQPSYITRTARDSLAVADTLVPMIQKHGDEVE